MATIERARRSSVYLKLNAGQTASGGTIVKSCGLGKVLAAADKTKVMNVVALMLPVLEFPLVRVERTEVSTLENV